MKNYYGGMRALRVQLIFLQVLWCMLLLQGKSLPTGSVKTSIPTLGLSFETPNGAVYFLSHPNAQEASPGAEITAFHAIKPRIMMDIVVSHMEASLFTCETRSSGLGFQRKPYSAPRLRSAVHSRTTFPYRAALYRGL